MASFTSSIDITNGGTYPLNITNGTAYSTIRSSLNGKMNKIQSYLQSNLPETCSALPTSLTHGKLIIYNNQLYFGNSSNTPVQAGGGNFKDLVVTNSISLGRYRDSTIGVGSVATGASVYATGAYSHAEGRLTIAGAYCAHAEGDYNHVTGEYAHAEGSYNTVSGNGAHAEGSSNNITSNFAHAEGYQNTISEYAGHAEGFYNIVNNYAAHASGKLSKNMTGGGSYDDSTGDAFIIGNGVGIGTTMNNLSITRSNAFRVTYNGKVYGTSSFNSTGADYAEYFEWLDGNPNSEDRVGYFVTLDGDRIRIASSGDYILGIVSGQPCIIGNADEDWLGRWEHDNFNRFILEYLEDEEVKVDTNDMTENEINTLRIKPNIKEKDGAFYRVITKVVDYETPSYRYKANPDYDASQPYVERKNRKEWDAVGMVGVLSVWDDGTCKVNGFCQVSDNGIATIAEKYIPGQTYRVIKRITDNIIKVIFK